jgi:hypothetical protein
MKDGSHLNPARSLVIDGKQPEVQAEYARLLTIWSAADPDRRH